MSVHPHVCGEIPLSGLTRHSNVGTSPRLWGDSSTQINQSARAGYIPTSVGRFQLDAKMVTVWAVHPHVCGEILLNVCDLGRVNGTSPRLWGDSKTGHIRHHWKRYIPTSVGRLPGQRANRREQPVHPHVCGEIDPVYDRDKYEEGTSPRLWGDFRVRCLVSRRCRYIPTSVGRLEVVRSGRGDLPVHPHVCGEISESPRSSSDQSGTSPRLWGDYTPLNCWRKGGRYIPTSVGRLPGQRANRREQPVHPHVCGEIDPVYDRDKYEEGTSPRLWGDFRVRCLVSRRCRYIPTSVGRLEVVRSGRGDLPVHPHVCGEISESPRSSSDQSGTSPRLWGDYTPLNCWRKGGRYIPTSVGRLDGFPQFARLQAVHPHVCGEITSVQVVSWSYAGTSPRLWGDSCWRGTNLVKPRYIPTSVGRLSPKWSASISAAVHPHVCGEIVGDGRLRDGGRWYIPTSVGRLKMMLWWGTRFSVHPHVCGEIFRAKTTDKVAVGTSPRLWGDFHIKVIKANKQRYIPTSVGRLASNTTQTTMPTVHPHVCGEIPRAEREAKPARGTSPRLWGDCKYHVLTADEWRYIPTSVGRFQAPFSTVHNRTVHPHVCGEIY